jgi:two-component system cell cycle sensor histidine kinase/response regulator CckA
MVRMAGGPPYDEARDGLQAKCDELSVQVKQLGTRVAASRGLEALLHSILDNVPDFVVKVSPEGTIQFINRVAPGLEASRVVGSTIYDFLAPDGVETARDALERAVRTGGVVTYESSGAGPHGQVRRYFSRVAPIRRGHEIESLILIATDVTELSEARTKLRERQQQLELAAEATGVGLWSWTRAGNRVDWDEACCRIFGLEKPPATFEEYLACVHPEHRSGLLEGVQRALETGIIDDYEYRIVRPDGEVRWLLGKGRVERDEQGNVLRLVGGLLDVSAQRQLQDDLMQARKLEAVGQLAAGIAHNFNNMLTVMLSTSELAAKRSTPEVAGLLEEGRLAAERASTMVRQLMLFSGKGTRAERREEDLGVIARRTVAMCRATFPREIAVELAVDTGLDAVRCDAAQVEQALLNVLLNARDALDEVFDRPLTIRVAVTGGGDSTLRVQISDNGCGMDEEVSSRATEPFFTTKGPGRGTGLGLATTYAIVKEHGGRLEIESLGAHKGTRVTLLFPALDHPPPRTVESEPSEAPLGSGERILLVDDEPLVRESVTRILVDAGYVVDSAVDGEEALRLLADAASRFDLVLLDQSMPGIGGRTVSKEARARHPELAVVSFSGYASNLEEADAELEKPVSRFRLLSTLRAVLDRRTPR